MIWQYKWLKHKLEEKGWVYIKRFRKTARLSPSNRSATKSFHPTNCHPLCTKTTHSLSAITPSRCWMNRIRGLHSFEKLPECHQVTMVAPLVAAFASAPAVGPHHWYCTAITSPHQKTHPSSIARAEAFRFLEVCLKFYLHKYQSCCHAFAAASIANNKQRFWSFGGRAKIPDNTCKKQLLGFGPDRLLWYWRPLERRFS